MIQTKTVLITGGATRIGASMVEFLHAKGMNIIIHYRHSAHEASVLANKLNQQRANSAALLPLDLLDTAAIPAFIQKAVSFWGGIDVLINNASSYYKTPMGTVTEAHWNDLMASNLTAPFFIAQAAAPSLEERQGTIINIVDTKAEVPAKQYPVYNIAKAGLWMLTKTLAKELAPAIRVNAIAPGSILAPIDESITTKEKKIPLQCMGTPEDIAKAAYFLIQEAPYITGTMLVVDGGKLLHSPCDDC